MLTTILMQVKWKLYLNYLLSFEKNSNINLLRQALPYPRDEFMPTRFESVIST